MVDALLSAAAESDSILADIIAARNNEFIVHHAVHKPSLRFCEFCHSSNTPTWRRGPAGKGSLCNACGIKWRLRKRLKKNEKGSPSSSPPSTPDKHSSSSSPSPITHKKKRKEYDGSHSSSSSLSSSSPSKTKAPRRDKEHSSSHSSPSPSSAATTLVHAGEKDNVNKRKKYYCKYCDQTFSLSQFRNSQQFGAHCSNCSRRPGRYGEDGVTMYDMDGAHMREYGYDRSYSPMYGSPSSNAEWSPSSPESPLHPHAPPAPACAPSAQTNNNNNRNGLLMRLLYVVEHQLVDVHELAEIKDELSTLKDELISREEARKAEVTTMRARVREDLADIKTSFRNSVAAHEQLAATRLMEMEQTIKMRGNGLP